MRIICHSNNQFHSLRNPMDDHTFSNAKICLLISNTVLYHRRKDQVSRDLPRGMSAKLQAVFTALQDEIDAENEIDVALWHNKTMSLLDGMYIHTIQKNSV